MNKVILCIGFLVGITFTSCSQQGIRHAESKEEYLSILQKLSDKRFKKQLRQDAEFLEALIDSVNTLEFYYMFSLGLGGSSDGTRGLDTAEVFQLPGRSSLLNDIQDSDRKLYFEQHIALPESNFGFSMGFDEEGFQLLDPGKIKYELEELFRGNKVIAAADLGLKQADSVRVKTTYTFPTGFDTFALPMDSNGEVICMGVAIEIDQLNADGAEFTIPLELATSVMGHHGITPEGIRIASNSYSAFPVSGIAPEVQASLRTLRDQLGLTDKNTLLKELSEEEGQVFDHIRQLLGLMKRLEEIEGNPGEDVFDEINALKDLQNEYASLFTVTKMSYRMTFPHNVEEIHLYMADAYDSLSRTFIATNARLPQDYLVFFDKEKDSFGIADNKGEVIIPATYENLHWQQRNYFFEDKGDIRMTYYLDPATKKLEVLSENITFVDILDDDLTVFEDKDDYVGVLDKDLKEIIPFSKKYVGASLHGDILVMMGTKRGRSFFDFYTRKGEEVPIPETIRNYHVSGKGLSIESREGLHGYIKNKGQLSVPVRYRNQGGLSEELAAFRYPKGHVETRTGIINRETGEIILSPEQGYYYIEPFSDGLALVELDGGRKGYIDKEGRVRISPIYRGAREFYKGYAGVRTEEGKIQLIDTNGRVVKSFPDRVQEGNYSYSNYVYLRKRGDTAYYDINERYYDYRGEPLDESFVKALEENKDI